MLKMDLKQEEHLINQAKKNPEMFGRLYDLYFKQIFNYVLKRTGDYEIAKDLTAEVFLKAFQKWTTFHWKGISVAAWFYKIATNEIHQWLRSKKYKPRLLNEFSLIHPQAITTTCENHHLKERSDEENKQQEDFRRIQFHLKGLSPKYQDVIALRYFEGKNISEISEILSKKPGTIKSLLHRGLEKLRSLV